MRYLVVLAALSLSACSPEGGQVCTGSDDPEALSGSYCEGAEISWDSVQLGWLDSFRTLRIRYGIDTDGGLDPRFEIQVDGLATELTVDTEISLSDYGYVRRWPGPGENAQILSDELESSSHLVFTELDARAGGSARARFEMLIRNGRTLRGFVEGTLVDITP